MQHASRKLYSSLFTLLSMFETSKDLLNIVIAVSVLLFTVFLVWIMYYLAQMLKQANQTFTDARELMKKIGDTVDIIREKIASTIATLSTLSIGIKEIMSFVQKRKEKSSNTHDQEE